MKKLFLPLCLAFLLALTACDGVGIGGVSTGGIITINGEVPQLQVRTAADFIPHLAEQIRAYNEIAPILWVNNPVLDISFLLADSGLEQFWLISPSGEIDEMTHEQAIAHGFPPEMEFLLFTFFEDGSGVYLRFSDNVVTDEAAARVALLHPQTGDAFRMLAFGVHELFHHLVQEGSRWAENMEMPEDLDAFYQEFATWSEDEQAAFFAQVEAAFPNLDREEFLENTEARAVRHTMLRQIFRALAADDERLVLDLLATYEHYRTNFSDEHHKSVNWDRVEGTAQYFDVLAAIMAVHSVDFSDVDRAVAELAVLADSQNSFMHYGLVKEGYIMGWVGFLLNRYIEPSAWQQRMMDEPNATFLGILSEKIAEPLPEFTPMSAAERAAFDVRLAEEIELMAEAAERFLD